MGADAFIVRTAAMVSMPAVWQSRLPMALVVGAPLRCSLPGAALRIVSGAAQSDWCRLPTLDAAAESSPLLRGPGSAATVSSPHQSPSPPYWPSQGSPLFRFLEPPVSGLGCERDAARWTCGARLWAPTGPSERKLWAGASLGQEIHLPPSQKLNGGVYGPGKFSRGTRDTSGQGVWLSFWDHSAHRKAADQLRFAPRSARCFSSASSPPPKQEQGGQGEELLVTQEVVMRERVRVRPPPKRKSTSGGGGSSVDAPSAEAPPSTVGVGLIRLNRPKALNALCAAMGAQFSRAMDSLQGDPRVGAVVVTGSAKAFAAGADIREMQSESFASALGRQMLSGWEAATHGPNARKPIIAAVNGHALGGGCELALMCDIILVGESAVFGQPEVTLGVIPGMGGTQRLVRAVGKARAMEMILGGGTFLTAKEAVQLGLASRLVEGDAEAVVDEALALGARIASMSAPVVALAKECVNAAFESTLSSGLDKERTTFYATFSLEDQKEGMVAFAEKREPLFKNK